MSNVLARLDWSADGSALNNHKMLEGRVEPLHEAWKAHHETLVPRCATSLNVQLG